MTISFAQIITRVFFGHKTICLVPNSSKFGFFANWFQAAPPSYGYIREVTDPSSPSMVRLLFLPLPPSLLLVVFSRSTLILILLPCSLNCLSSSLMNSRSSAGKLPNLAAREGAFVVVFLLALVLALANLVRGLLGFVVAGLAPAEDDEVIAVVLGVLVGRFFSVVTFLG